MSRLASDPDPRYMTARTARGRSCRHCGNPILRGEVYKACGWHILAVPPFATRLWTHRTCHEEKACREHP